MNINSAQIEKSHACVCARINCTVCTAQCLDSYELLPVQKLLLHQFIGNARTQDASDQSLNVSVSVDTESDQTKFILFSICTICYHWSV